MKRTGAAIVAGLAFSLIGAPALADYVIDLVPSGTTTVEQGATTSFTVAATNTGTTAIELGQLTLGIQLLADGSPTGSLAIDSIGVAPTNSPWSGDLTFSGPGLSSLANGAINGTTDYYLMSITENDLGGAGSIPAGESRNIGLIGITTTNDALGAWRLFIVNENLESGPLTAITTPSFETVAFANLLAPAAPDAGVSFTGGTFIAVPEPATATLLASAAVLAVAAARRRRRAA